MAAGADVPHDLATFVVEEALDLRHGFWGCVADGATFRSTGRTRTRQGRDVIAAHRDALDEAEVLVNEQFFAWRRGDVVDPTVQAALDETRDAWAALAEGDELVRTWPHRGRPARDGRRRPRSRR